MLSSSRPPPPTKVRRAASMTAKADVNSTPPPAYGSTFLFPSRNRSSSDFVTDILNTPMEATRRLTAWANESPSSSTGEESPHPEDLEWMNEKSRDELHELLLNAHGIIKEREQELGLATNIVKRVYDHNVALKSKHEAFLAKIPMCPSLSHSPSPEPSSKGMHRSHSASESNLPDPLKTHARKVSIAMADISLLADQNAELLSKLQKLEEEATSADIAGRRELKRLEKEIVYLRDALEKTQAKSEELEGKVQNAVTSEAVRRKKEREAMRNAARNNKEEVTVLDFAPPGSKFGGPSERYSLLDLPKEESRILSSSPKLPLGYNADFPDEDVVSDQTLIARLLSKVQELEDANSRILHQQVETANQLAHVQQDTLNMTKVYELLSDHDTVQLELELEEDAAPDRLPIAKERPENPTIRFRSLRRNIEHSISEIEPFVFPVHETKARKTVLGLFSEQEGSVAKDDTKASNPERSAHRRPSSGFSWGAPQSSTISSSRSSLAGPLSPRHFTSPTPQSEHPDARTLQNELEGMFGQGTWNLSGPNHMRTASLSNLSLFSTLSTPSSAPGSLSHMLPGEVDRTTTTAASGCDSGLKTPRDTPELAVENSLRLSVEPPSPDIDIGAVGRTIAARKHTSRLQNMSRTLRSRKNRWIDRASEDGSSHSQQANYKDTSALSPKSRRCTPGLPQQMSNAIDGITDNLHVLSSNDPEGGKRSGARSDFPSQRTTPQAERGLECEPDDEDTQTTVCRRAEVHVMANKNFLFQAWLWFQFTIVVLFFIFTMARKGPNSVLVGAEGVRKERRAVGRR